MRKKNEFMQPGSFSLPTLTKFLRKNSMKKAYLFLIEILFFPALIFCQTGEFVLFAKKVDTPPSIDGLPNEAAWKNASQACDFIQYTPHKGKPGSVKTIVKVLYDSDCLYFCFICYDPEPEKIQGGTNRRDGLTHDSGTDSVTVEIDTFDNNRSSYYFRTNHTGVQHDGRVKNNGQSYDQNWDGIWKSAGAMTKVGWTAEIAIPFSSIKYRQGKNQNWGIQFSRYYPRRFKMDFWTGPMESKDKISNFGSLTGLDLETSRKKLEIIPHIISELQEGESTNFDTGLDINHSLSPSISGHLTVNPDFATVEADQEQVNLTRFELDLPEKRNFFLEGNHAFKQTIQLFYSRRIGDIYGGLKIHGKTGSYETSALSVQTRNEGEEEVSANVSVFRVMKDVLESSNLGFLVANKNVSGKNQGALGIDADHFITRTLHFSGQVAMSYGERDTDYAVLLKPSYISNTLRAHVSYTYLGNSFGDHVNTVGFVQDDNRHEIDSALSKTFWMKKWGLDRILYSSKYNIYWGVDKILRSWQIRQSFAFDLQNKLSLKLLHDQEYKLYEKGFRNYGSTIELGYNTRAWESGTVSFQFGENFDSDFSLLMGTIHKNINRNLSVEYSLAKLSLSPDPKNESTWIHVILAHQYFTKDFFFKLFYQINASINKHYTQAIIVYRFQPPFGLIQLAYQNGSPKLGDVDSRSHTVFLKLAFVF